MPVKPLTYLFCTIGILLACSFSNPAFAAKKFDASNICSIFKAKPGWKHSAFTAERKWGTRVETVMSIIFHESSFRSHVRPKKKKRFLLWSYKGRDGSSKGYAQATLPTWRQYKKELGRWSFISRTNFYDSALFIGWYNHKSRKVLNLKPTDVFELYIAYHEGWSGFKSRRWRGKKIAEKAKEVADTAARYTKQLPNCSRKRRRTKAKNKRR